MYGCGGGGEGGECSARHRDRERSTVEQADRQTDIENRQNDHIDKNISE